MGEITVTVRARLGDEEAFGMSSGDPIREGLVEIANATGPRDIRSAITDDRGTARLTVDGPGTFFVSLIKNIDGGGALVADTRVAIIEEEGQTVELEARSITD